MIILILIVIIFLSAISVSIFLQLPRFGKPPRGLLVHQLQQSPNFSKDQFKNKHYTPALTNGATPAGVIKDFLFNKSKMAKPSIALPSVKTNLLTLDPTENVIVWFGHSSYFMQIDGKKIVVDPVLSKNASPVKFTTHCFKGTHVYTTDDLPDIDYLFITHDHYDHLDYETMVRLKLKVKKVITGLGVSSHLIHWGYDRNRIIEKDWDEEVLLDKNFKVYTTTARHFSGRKFKRNNTLWLSFVFITPTKKIFIGGDSGYGTHFKQIGQQFGPFDLAILENGQYNKSWQSIHMLPEEVVQAAEDLKANALLPVHWSKFSLSLHAWDEPIIRLLKEASVKGVVVWHPMIGESLYVDKNQATTNWWEGIP